MAPLQRLVLDFRSDELVVRCMYSSEDDFNPGTKRRTKVVADLVKTGLEQALQALEGRLDMVGVSGFVQRQDILLATISQDDAEKLVKGA